MKKIEIACFNLQSALIALKAGADRVELCADMSVGGTTPKIEMIQQSDWNIVAMKLKDKLSAIKYFIPLPMLSQC